VSSPYAPVTQSAWFLPEGYRCTAYWWAVHRGLPLDLGSLMRLGRQAATEARWAGTEPRQIPEGPYPAVHTWPGWIWAAAEARLRAEPGCGEPDPHGYRGSGDYG
jgi:hypothetical protein